MKQKLSDNSQHNCSATHVIIIKWIKTFTLSFLAEYFFFDVLLVDLYAIFGNAIVACEKLQFELLLLSRHFILLVLLLPLTWHCCLTKGCFLVVVRQVWCNKNLLWMDYYGFMITVSTKWYDGKLRIWHRLVSIIVIPKRKTLA